MTITLYLHIGLTVAILMCCANASPPYSLHFGQRLDGDDDLFLTSANEPVNTFIQHSTNPKVSILQAPITTELMSKKGQSLSDLLRSQNTNIVKSLHSGTPVIQSSISSSVSSTTTDQERNRKTVSRGQPSIFPSSSQMFPKTLPASSSKKSNFQNTDKVAGSSLVSFNPGDDIVELPIKFTSGSVSPVILGNKKNIIRGNSKNIQVISLGNASSVKQNLLKLNLGNSNISKTNNIKLVSSTTRAPSKNTNKITSINLQTGNVAKQLQNIKQIQKSPIPVPNKVIVSNKVTNNNDVSNDVKRLTIGEYLLNLNGKNGIVVLPMSELFNRKNTATSGTTTPKPKSIISQLAEFAVSEGIVEDLKKDSRNQPKVTNINSIRQSQNDIAAISLGSTGSMQNSNRKNLNVKPIQTSGLLNLLLSLQTGNSPQQITSQNLNNLELSNINTRQATETTTRTPNIFRSTLADLFFVKGQWIGTLIGGLIDMGLVVSDAVKELASGSSSSRISS